MGAGAKDTGADLHNYLQQERNEEPILKKKKKKSTYRECLRLDEITNLA